MGRLTKASALLTATLACCSFILPPISTAPTNNNTEEEPQLDLISSEGEGLLVKVVESMAANMHSDKFLHDPVLIQMQAVTKYVYPKSKVSPNRVILEKRNPDMGKDAIVLSSLDSHFAIPTPRGAIKRQFVVMKRSAKGAFLRDMIPYHLSMVYVRDFSASDANNDAFDLPDGQVVVEWDIWDQRPRTFFAGWNNCDFSMMFTCTSYETIINDAVTKIKAENKKAERRRKRGIPDGIEKALEEEAGIGHAIYKRDSGPVLHVEEEVVPEILIEIVSEPGYDPKEYNDLYLDFDFHRFDEIFKIPMITVENKNETRRRKRSAQGSVKGNFSNGQRKGFLSGIFKAGASVKVGAGGGAAGGVGGILSGLLKSGLGAVGGVTGGVGLNVGTNLIGNLLGAGANLAGGLTGGVGANIGGDLIGNLLGGLGGGGGGDLIGSLLGAGANLAGGLTGGIGANIGGDLIGNLLGGLGGGGGGDLIGSLLGAGSNLAGGLTGGIGANIGGDLIGNLLGGLGGGSGGDLIGSLLGAGSNLVGGLTGGVGANIGGDLIGNLLGGLGGGGGGDLIGSLLGAGSNLVGGLTGGVGANIGGDLIGNLLGGLGGGAGGGIGGDLIGNLLGAGANLAGGLTGGGGTNLIGNILGAGANLGSDLVGNVLGAGANIAGGIGANLGLGIGGNIGAGISANIGVGIGGNLIGSIFSVGENLLSCWDTIGNNIIETASKAMVQVGVPAEWAKLSALGAQMCVNTASLFASGALTPFKIGAEIAGTIINGGSFGGKGFDGPGSMPSNEANIFGILYQGAENGKQFFFPLGSMVVGEFKTDSGKLPGFFKPDVPGNPDAFFPEDEKAAGRFMGQRGKIVIKAYTPTSKDSDPGIAGTLSAGNQFAVEEPKSKALYNPKQAAEGSIWAPPDLKSATTKRPGTTKDNRKVFYGYFFKGVEGSPDIFIPEGDTLSGFFVPEDPDHPEIKENPHGVFTPNHPAGHGTFTAEFPKEVEHIKEVRGVFVPDAIDLAGGIGGKLSRSQTGETVFSMVMDTPATDFMYVPDSEDVKNVWCSMIPAEEWNYSPPALSSSGDDDGDTGGAKTRKKRDNQGGLLGLRLRLGASGAAEKQFFGLKIETKTSVAFIPQDYTVSGAILLVDNKKKYKPCEAQLSVKNPAEPLAITISKAGEDTDEIDKTVVGLFVPHNFAGGDAIIGQFTFNPDRTGGKLQVAQKTQSHFWTASQELWLPPGYVELLMEDNTEEDAKAEAKTKFDSKFTDQSSSSSVLGVAAGAQAPPKKPSNYKFGKMYKADPAMEANVVDSMPHQYLYGFFIQCKESPEPIFSPDTGVQGIFVPEKKTVKPAKGFYFPAKGTLKSGLVLENQASIPDGTMGNFHTLEKDGKQSKGFIKGILKGGLLAPKTGEFELVGGWQQSATGLIDATKLPAGYKKIITADHLKPLKKALSYAMVDVGGGHKGVLVEGAESMDDANNPIFQQFLHFRAQQSGDVNPWGLVSIIDPIARPVAKVTNAAVGEAVGIFGGVLKLGMGMAQNVVNVVGGGILGNVMKGFSVSNWEFPLISEIEAGVELLGLKLGVKLNVASMLDFRMFLMKKYNCKRSKIDGKWVRLFVPRSSEAHLDLVEIAKPRPEWLKAVKGAGKLMINPSVEGIAGTFSSLFSIPLDVISEFEKLVGTAIPNFSGKPKDKKGPADWKTTAQFEEFGDAHSCDEIKLDEFNVAQAVASMAGVAEGVVNTGMDLGFQLVGSIGSTIQFSQIATKLLKTYENKKDSSGERRATLQSNLQQSTTDILGGELNLGASASAAASGHASASGSTSAKAGGKAGLGRSLSEDDEDDEYDQVPKSKKNQSQKKKTDVKKKNNCPDQKSRGRSFLDEAPEDDESSRDHAKILPGWKTQHKNAITPNFTHPPDGVIFYGVGNCEQLEAPDMAEVDSMKPDKIIKFYLQVMRIDCMPNSVSRVMALINQKYLQFSPDMTFFEIPPNNQVIGQLRISPTETRRLSQAFEFHAFTRTFQHLRKQLGAEATSGIVIEPHVNITRSVRFFTEMSFYIIENAKSISPTHSVRMIRNLLATLRTVLTKVEQDSLVLKGCEECVTDKMITDGDKFRIVSLIQFIINGLGPHRKEGKMVGSTFANFVKLNKQAIEQRVREFERQFPTKLKNVNRPKA